MDVYRQSPVPVIYTQLEFVRAPSTCLLADCADDLTLLNLLQRVAAGHACVSELESPHTLILKAEFPDDILDRSGTTGEVIEWRVFQWKLWDAESLVTHSQPAEAVHPTNAGITPEFLNSLAHPKSCLPLLRTTQKVFDSGKRKGYQLSSETTAKIEGIEKPLIATTKRTLATIKLTEMKKLKPAAKTSASKAAGDSQVSLKLRDLILRKGKYLCVFCGQGSPTIVLEVNHIVPRSLINKLHLDSGLHNAPANLCVTCFHCNRGKSDNLATEDIEFYRNAFSSPDHPNHSILAHLEKIAELQTL